MSKDLEGITDGLNEKKCSCKWLKKEVSCQQILQHSILTYFEITSLAMVFSIAITAKESNTSQEYALVEVICVSINSNIVFRIF